MEKTASLLLLLIMIPPLLITPAAALEPGCQISSSYARSPYYQRLLDVVTDGNGAENLINTALSQLGYHEGNTPGDNSGTDPFGNLNITEYGYYYGMNHQPWCAMFITWCAMMLPESQVLHRSALAQPPSFGLEPISPLGHMPRGGELVFFGTEDNYSHVGIVIAVSGEYFYTVEGNSDDAVRLVRRELGSPFILNYGSWTDEAASFEGLDLDGIVTLTFSNNGASGGMKAVSAPYGGQLRLYPNAVIYDDDTGEPIGDTFVYREGYELAGWYIRRESDGAWLTSSGFMSMADIAAAGGSLTIVPDAAQLTPDGSWSTGRFAEFNAFAAWQKPGEAAPASPWLDGEEPFPFLDVAKDDWFTPAVKKAMEEESLSSAPASRAAAVFLATAYAEIISAY